MRLSIDLPDEMHRALKVQAATEGKTISDLVRTVVKQYLNGNYVYGVAPSGNTPPARADVSSQRGRLSGADLSKSAQAKGQTRK